MTDRLSQLLHQEATHIPTPAVPDPARLAIDGRRLRRRRQVTNGLAAAAAAAVVAVGSAAVWQGVTDERSPDVAAEIPRDAVVYGWEDQVHIDDLTVSVPGSVTDVDLTAQGALVTSQVPDRLTLVRTDGTSVDLGSPPDPSQVVTDPDSEVFVYTEMRAGELVLVVRALESGDVVQELPVDGQGGRPGLSFDGGTVYLSYGKDGIVALDLASGDRSRLHLTTSGLPAIQDGRAVLSDVSTSSDYRVVDIASGETLLTFPGQGLIDSSLSPDTRWIIAVRDTIGSGLVPLDEESPPEVTVYDITSGEQVVLDEVDSGAGWAWTLAGELFRIDGDEVVRCNPASGSCARTPAPASVPKYGNPALPGVPSF